MLAPLPPARAASTPSPREVRILVVEDDPALARAVRRLLEEEEGRVVDLMHDVASACRALRTHAYDLVISDFELPGGTGADVLACATSTQPETPRVLMSSHTEWETAAQAINEGEVFRVIAKPFRDVSLLGAVAQALDLKELRDGRRELRHVADRYARELAAANERLRVQNAALDLEVRRRTADFLAAIVGAADLRANGIESRSRSVAGVAEHLARTLGMDGEVLDAVRLGALLHDIGSIGLCDEAIEGGRPRLADAERRRVPELGWSMLCRVGFLRQAARVVRQHRERWDGRGYPEGMAKDDISLGARIVAVAIRYQELVAAHAQPDDVAHASALGAMQREAGFTLDPALVRVLAAQPATALAAALTRGPTDSPSPARLREGRRERREVVDLRDVLGDVDATEGETWRSP